MSKTALIIGASGGIGGAIATQLAEQGWNLALQGRNETALQQTVERCHNSINIDTRLCELNDPEQVADLAQWALTIGVDALVWSAGGGRSTPSGPDAIDAWRETLQVCLHAPMQLTAKLLPQLKQRRGALLYILGMYARIGMSQMAAHCAARHGLEGFTKALFEELRPEGVRVSVIHPGFVYTNLTNTERIDPDKIIQPQQMADSAALVLNMEDNACVRELTIFPTQSPYR